jgi:hypothetical protein
MLHITHLDHRERASICGVPGLIAPGRIWHIRATFKVL